MGRVLVFFVKNAIDKIILGFRYNLPQKNFGKLHLKLSYFLLSETIFRQMVMSELLALDLFAW